MPATVVLNIHRSNRLDLPFLCIPGEDALRSFGSWNGLLKIVIVAATSASNLAEIPGLLKLIKIDSLCVEI